DRERLAEERRLRMSTAQDGCLLLHGVLDPVGGAAVRTALEPLAQPSGAHDDRNRDQRYADALVELASAGKPANLQVTATIETLTGLAGAAAAEMEVALPISATSVRRMAGAVPANHIVRRLAAAVDFGFVRSLTKQHYSTTGQPSVDPVVLFKLWLLGYLCNIRSERRLCEEASLNLAWRWFLGYELDEA